MRKNQADMREVSTSSKAEFFTGCAVTFCFIYLVLFGVLGTLYDFEAFSIVFAYSILFHVALVPFIIYMIGGVIFVCTPDSEYISVYPKLWRLIMWCAWLCFIIIILSEIVHRVEGFVLRF